MGLNLPVDQHEYDDPASDLLLSSTNAPECIKDCNPTFVKTSSYSFQELVGRSVQDSFMP